MSINHGQLTIVHAAPKHLSHDQPLEQEIYTLFDTETTGLAPRHDEIVADGWGAPWGKISKYNAFMDDQIRFTTFKLFYRWDEPLMTQREALRVDGSGEEGLLR